MSGTLGSVPDTGTLKRTISAGAPVSPQILERFSALLPSGAQIFTPYGATEALPVALIGSTEVLKDTRHQTAQGAGTCVGRPVYAIGRMTRDRGVVLKEDGVARPLAAGGWDHFAG